jgi:predicted CXXCH cytochrome family protein
MIQDHPMKTSLPAALSVRRWLPAVILLAAVVATAGLFLSGAGRQAVREAPVLPSPDVPLPVFASPFLNTKPGVQYVGDEACADCHAGLSQTFHAHPMGRSLAPVSPGDGLESYPATFEAQHMRFAVERRGDRVFHKVMYLDDAGNPVPEVEVEGEVQYVIGSGAQGRSYIVNHDGFLYQSPISWFTRKKAWDVSPGYEKTFLHFVRAINNRCLFCHCNDARPVEGTVNGYRTDPLFRRYAIGCERCHGPGEAHVALRQRGEDPGQVDYSIVNPRHLEPALRAAICEQCHLQGVENVVRRGHSYWDFRPGLRLHDFISVYVKPPEMADGYKVVSHVEQMHISRCFIASEGKFGCTSCHDPHALPKPEQKVTFYRDACLRCHLEDRGSKIEDRPSRFSILDPRSSTQAAACTLPLAERRQKDSQDSCFACHMPRGPAADVAHGALTDHRIVRSPEHPPRVLSSGLGPGSVPMLFFHKDLVHGPDPGRERDLGLAMVAVAQDPGDEGVRRRICQRALPLLEQAVSEAPGDAAAQEALGYALWQVGGRQQALEALDAALRRQPRQVTALGLAIEVAAASGRLEGAQDYARRLVEVNPWDPQGWAFLARVYVARGEWPEVGAACRAALKVDPANVSARCLLIRSHLHRGDRDAARADFERIVALNPPQLEEIRRWYEELLRSGSR